VQSGLEQAIADVKETKSEVLDPIIERDYLRQGGRLADVTRAFLRSNKKYAAMMRKWAE